MTLDRDTFPTNLALCFALGLSYWAQYRLLPFSYSYRRGIRESLLPRVLSSSVYQLFPFPDPTLSGSGLQIGGLLPGKKGRQSDGRS